MSTLSSKVLRILDEAQSNTISIHPCTEQEIDTKLNLTYPGQYEKLIREQGISWLVKGTDKVMATLDPSDAGGMVGTIFS